MMIQFDVIVNINSPSLSARREHVSLFECVFEVCSTDAGITGFLDRVISSQDGGGRAGH